jgi:hypothetical protein
MEDMTMDDVSRAFIDKSRSLLAEDYIPKIDRCLDRLGRHDIWWRPNERSNSIGNLILHLCGNVTMWIVGGVGNLPFERNRQLEFDERTEIRRTIFAAVYATSCGRPTRCWAGLTAARCWTVAAFKTMT